MAGIKDKNGDILKAGDKIMVTATVVDIMDLEDGTGLLRVKWDEEEVPIIDYIKSTRVEKALITTGEGGQ